MKAGPDHENSQSNTTTSRSRGSHFTFAGLKSACVNTGCVEQLRMRDSAASHAVVMRSRHGARLAFASAAAAQSRNPS